MHFVLKLLTLFGISNAVFAEYQISCHCGGKGLQNEECPNDESQCSITGGLCYKSMDKTVKRVYEKWGCVSVHSMEYITQCSHLSTPFVSQDLMLYCCNTSFCNLGDEVPIAFPSPSATPLEDYIIIIIIVSCIIAVVIGIGLVIAYKCCRHDKLDESRTSSDPCIISDMKADDSMDFDWSMSGSGSGLPLLIQKTISRQIKLHEVIGKGRYGEVFRGEFHSENVAVKKFTSRDEDSWCREREIYQTTMLRHDNILGFIAADNKDMGTWMELWLVSEYHKNGSLFDYLKYNQVTKEVLITMARSIASGLAHLHMEIIGTQGKPPIAHCDLKSKNILVKKNLECAIADLGLAVRHDAQRDSIDTPINNRVGTKRYMAPEILDETMNTMHFDCYKRADIYGVGLVFWELVRRTNVNNQERSYVLPYFDVVADDPSIEEMREVVCDKQMRPTIYEDWMKDDCLVAMVNIMKECWYTSGSSRLTALNIKKKLIDLRKEEGIKE